MTNIIYYDYVVEPVGSFLVAVSQEGLMYLGLLETDLSHLQKSLGARNHVVTFLQKPEVTAPYSRELVEYFQGKRRKFEQPLDLSWFGTDFQRAVWQTLVAVPYGEISSYSALAANIQRPLANQAVGTAVGKNPIPIVIPCHRILRKDGSIGGFSGGLALKRYLLKIEGLDY
ncbi:methylated-DNA--[protein]-cysteine S-methyltransferase [Vagococcus salmoninarum]|uniref:methylated-DNA--[protein]-cysteine S-methyltransferase n=1 Tax=Vagococcus salmoninarum TaxID=2739 RepID=UPI003F95F666